jgi:DNA-directed RNA polymerase specialized sigma24 family protein
MHTEGNTHNGEGDSINRKEQEYIVRQQFDSYCKKVIANEYRDIVRAVRRKRRAGEVLMVNWADVDSYVKHPHDCTVFKAGGGDIPITSDRLAEELFKLSERRREIVLLAECCGETDGEIAARLNIKRSTVQYQRTQALKALRAGLGVQDGQ